MAFELTPAFKKSMIDKKLEEGTLKLMLLTSSHTIDLSTQTFIDDVSVNELSPGGDYGTNGGFEPNNVSVTISGDSAVLDFDDISFTGVDTSTQGTLQFIVAYIDTGTASTSEIVGQDDIGAQTFGSGDTKTINIDPSGLFSIN